MKKASSSKACVRAGLPAAILAMAVAAVMVATPAAAEDDVAKLWSKHCQSCHGADGKGKTKTGEKLKVEDLSSAEKKAKLTKQKAVDSMKVGVKDAEGKVVMKAFADKLSPEEIEKLADYSLAFK